MEEDYDNFIIANRTVKLFNNNHLSDVKVIAGIGKDEKSFHAHSLILKISSPVFEKLLQNQNELKFPSIDSSVMEAVLKYIYTDNLPEISSEVAIKTYDVAEYFTLRHLKTLCCNYICKILTPINAAKIFEFAYEKEFPSILSKSSAMLFKETDKILKNDGLNNISQNTIMKIIINASTVDEKVLMRKVIEWAINKSERLEDLLKPLIPHFCLSSEEKMGILMDYSLTFEKCHNIIKLNKVNELENQPVREECLIPLNFHLKNYNILKPLKRNDVFTIVFFTEVDCLIEAIALPIISKTNTLYTVQFEISFTDLKSKHDFQLPSSPRIFLQCRTDDLSKFKLHYPLFVKKRNPVKLKVVNLEEQLHGLDIIRHRKVNGQFEWNDESIAYVPCYDDDDSKDLQISSLLLCLIK